MSPDEFEEAGKIAWPNGWIGKDGRRLPNPALRMVRKITVTESGCWEWQGPRSNRGYALFSAGGKIQLGHRWAYKLANGAIAKGLVIDHLCRNPSCVNPAHLEAVTQSENVKRGSGPALAASRLRSKTHCVHGHVLSDENVYVFGPQKHRACRTCASARKKAWALAKRSRHAVDRVA